jgi:GDP-mannose 6-dehydrogenase
LNISVFGLGYVGAVVTGCFARDGHTVVGVDVRQSKVDMLNAGISPIVEPGLAELIADAHKAGRIRATTDATDAVQATDISLICVGTPSTKEGGLQTRFIEKVCEEIGQALAGKETYHVVVDRSTILPGTVETKIIPILERTSGKRVGEDFGVAMNPEFLRESSAIKDFDAPPKTVIGEYDVRSGDLVAQLYAELEAPLFRTSIRVAEMVKYADNVFHALKIVFGNEIGSIAKTCGMDSHEVMRIFCSDRKLNISPAYLLPGFAYGGSCLPKDLRALTYHARQLGVAVPVLDGIGHSNESHIERAAATIGQLGARSVAYLGVAFKADTDDLRETPNLRLVDLLCKQGCSVRLYDAQVLASIEGGTAFYLDEHLPEIKPLFVKSAAEAVEGADLVVIGNNAPEFRDVTMALPESVAVYDLVRLFSNCEEKPANYQGICW